MVADLEDVEEVCTLRLDRVTGPRKSACAGGAVVLFALLAAGLAVSPVRGDEPVREHETWSSFFCTVQNEVAYVDLYLQFDEAGQLEDSFLFGGVAPASGETDPWNWYSIDPSADAQGSLLDGQLVVEIPLVDEETNPAGAADVTASFELTNLTVVSAGKPDVGNFYVDNHVALGTFRERRLELVGSGSLGLPDGTRLDLEEGACAGWETTFLFRLAQPASYVYRTPEQSLIRCSLDDGSARGSLWMFVGDYSARIRAVVDLPTGDSWHIGRYFSGRWLSDLIYASLPYEGVEVPVSDSTGSWIGESALLDLAVVGGGESFDYALRSATWTAQRSGMAYPLAGSLRFPGDVAFDLGHCYIADETEFYVAGPAREAAPGGAPPPNDLPEGATPASPGTRSTAQTRGAAPEAEAPFECFPDGFAAIHTVWYSVAGTGGPVTIDTAGTNFDTVIAVYTPDGVGGYDPLPGGCVDDIDLEPPAQSLQAVLTFDTELGQTYLVQIGGTPADSNWGVLQLAVE